MKQKLFDVYHSALIRPNCRAFALRQFEYEQTSTRQRAEDNIMPNRFDYKLSHDAASQIRNDVRMILSGFLPKFNHLLKREYQSSLLGGACICCIV